MAEIDTEGAASANTRFPKCTTVYTYLTKDITQNVYCKLSHQAHSHSREKRLLASSSPSFPLSFRLSTFISAAPTGRISVEFDAGNFQENLSKIKTLLKIGQKYRSLYMKTYVNNQEKTLEISGVGRGAVGEGVVGYLRLGQSLTTRITRIMGRNLHVIRICTVIYQNL